MKAVKKSICIVLSLLMLVSAFSVLVVPASAAEVEEVSVGVESEFSQPGSSKNSAGDCVSYTRARFKEVYGFELHNTGGDNARGYYTNASSFGDTVSSTPRAGALAVWDYDTGGYGSHVAFVEKVSGNDVYITEGGFGDSGYHEDSLQLSNMHRRWNGHYQAFLGFVYVKGTGSTPPPTPSVTPTQCVSDGDYHVVSALDNSLGLNIAYDSTDCSANVQIWNNMTASNLSSLVTVTHIGSGYYTLTFRNSGKNLDIANGSTASGANVWQYDSNNSDAQKWIIKPTGDGYFNIISKLNTNLFLDVSGASATAGTNVQVYTATSSNAQKWKFIASGAPTGKTIEDGEYTISSARSRYACLNIFGGQTDDGVNVHLWNNMGFNVDNAKVEVKYLENGLYSIIFKKSGKSLDIDGAKNTIGTNVQQWTYAGRDAQKWIIKPAGDGYYYIISRCSGLAVDAQNAETDNGTNVQSYLWTKVSAQKWKFNLCEYNISYEPNGGKIYNDTVPTCVPDGYNTERGKSQVIVYTGVFGAKTTTNIYGDEYAFDENGKKVGVRYYGTEEKLNIPSGGFVVSKNSTAEFDLYNVGEKAEYAFLDTNKNIVYFCANKHDYNVVSKKAALGRAYGELAVPEKEGYSFDGWYTAADGGEQITSASIFNGIIKLYAHWSKVEETTPSQPTEPTQPTQATEPTQPEKKDISKWQVMGLVNKTYTGKAITQNIIVTNGSEVAAVNTAYTNNKNAGTATIVITGKGNYTGTIVKTFKINKANNKMTVKAASKTVKYSAIKKKAVTVSALTVKSAQGAVSYKKASGNAKITVNTNTGKLTVKKGTKKGTYTIKIKVTAKGNSNYNGVTKTVTVKIIVK